MPTRLSGRLEKSLNYLAWYWEAGAVLDVFHENMKRHRAGDCAIKPSSDIWCLTDELRQDLHRRACRSWCRLTGRTATYFPLSVDATAILYFRIRKRRKDEIEGFDQEVKEAIHKHVALDDHGHPDHPLFDAES
jgi:hypothetical protein